MRTYVVYDEKTGREPGLVGERFEDLGHELHYVDRMDLPAFAELQDPGLVLILGSHLAAHDQANAELVEAESQFARDALDAGIPIMAICYGAQLLARALGGTSYRNSAPEIGWQMVETNDEGLCPSGPWAQLHSDVFEAPPSAALIGTSAAGQQCFTEESHGARAIAWQFHPEVPVSRYETWLDEDADYYRGFGADIDALKAETRRREATSRTAAHDLVDSALAWLTSGGTMVCMGKPGGFEYVVRGDEVVISHHGKRATVLRGERAAQFLEDVDKGDPQELMARVTGNYKRGNERTARNHPRNR